MDKDEKEEFLKRENELQDQLADKESSLSKAEEALQAARNELKELRDTHATTNRDSERLRSETEQLRMQVEKIEFETKEAAITMDSLKEANGELTTELDDVKHQLLDARMSAKESSAMLDEKERLKKERMAQMMAGFDLGDDMSSTTELHIRATLQQLDSLMEIADSGSAVPSQELQRLRERLLETQGLVRQAEYTSNGAANGEHFDEGSESNDLQRILSRQQEENTRMRSELEALRKQAISGGNGASMNKQLADFDSIKKSLMRDLQNRCERVVELEISLDSTREQYNSILRSSNSKQQQKKLAFLERNLEQLTLVQRQLVEQNAQLKKEVAIAERKLVARGERIRGLEGLVAESQEKLMVANHKYVLLVNSLFIPKNQSLTLSCRFESQLLAVKERLEAAKQGSTRGLGGAMAPSQPNFANNPFGRIAKPLRGGGGPNASTPGEGAGVPTFAGLQASRVQSQEGAVESSGNKRTSWFFNQRT
jgi:kinesin family protein 5